MIKMGVLLPHLGPSQAAFMAISQINSFFGSVDYDFTLFYEKLVEPCTKPLCATMNMSEIWLFDGILISTTINNTITASKAIAPKRKLFYVWDLEWTRNQFDFLYNLQAFRNHKIELIARSMAHANMIDVYANRRLNAVIPNFNLRGILKYIGQTK